MDILSPTDEEGSIGLRVKKDRNSLHSSTISCIPFHLVWAISKDFQWMSKLSSTSEAVRMDEVNDGVEVEEASGEESQSNPSETDEEYGTLRMGARFGCRLECFFAR